MAKKYRNSLNEHEEVAAFVLMNVNVGSEKQVITDAKAMGCVKKAWLCFGVYDLILKIETPSMKELKELVTSEYRSIKNVKSVLILILTEENLALKPFSKYILANKSKKKNSRQERLSEGKNIQNIESSILVNN